MVYGVRESNENYLLGYKPHKNLLHIICPSSWVPNSGMNTSPEREDNSKTQTSSLRGRSSWTYKPYLTCENLDSKLDNTLPTNAKVSISYTIWHVTQPLTSQNPP